MYLKCNVFGLSVSVIVGFNKLKHKNSYSKDNLCNTKSLAKLNILFSMYLFSII